MISANSSIYDHASSFALNGYIDWKQNANYNIGDTVYIYCTKPLKRVMYKCEVVSCSMSFEESFDDKIFWINTDEYNKSKAGKFARLRLLSQVDTSLLSLDNLILHGLKAAPQGPVKISSELQAFIEKHFDDYYTEGYFDDIKEDQGYYEGHTRTVKVNAYERSSIARRKCIEYYGCSCLICGFDFEQKYGMLGKDFIHVHHLKPLHTLDRKYIVNYKTDLIPVCPNCHAMIHRIPDIENKTIDEIKDTLIPNPSMIHKIQIEPSNNNVINSVKSDLTIPNIHIGDKVYHKNFGNGTIISIDEQHHYIHISFENEIKKITIPNSFLNGFLQLV